MTISFFLVDLTKCYVGNLGDTRAVLCENDKAVRMSIDHKATNESEIKRVKYNQIIRRIIISSITTAILTFCYLNKLNPIQLSNNLENYCFFG